MENISLFEFVVVGLILFVSLIIVFYEIKFINKCVKFLVIY